MGSEKIRSMITTHGWDDATALALVLDYLHHEDMNGQALDLLIAGFVSSDKAAGLISFLQDCVMTGTDHDVARSVHASRPRTTSRGFTAPAPESKP